MIIKHKTIKPFEAANISIKDVVTFQEEIFKIYEEYKKIDKDALIHLMSEFENKAQARENPYANYSNSQVATLMTTGFIKDVEWACLKNALQKMPPNEKLNSSQFNCMWEVEKMRGDIIRVATEVDKPIVNEEETECILEIGKTSLRCPNTCFGGFHRIGERAFNNKTYKYIDLYIEPCGHVTIYGETYKEVAAAWEKIIRKQPIDMDCGKAGWTIYDHNNDPFGEPEPNIAGINIDPDNFWANYANADEEK